MANKVTVSQGHSVLWGKLYATFHKREIHSQLFFSQINYRIKTLDLSHNCFCETGGEHLGHMLGKRSTQL